ncbi:MAG: hypothetical protein F6K04_17635 [Leptolyngbya sp. SIO4C5]|nr:hypothetical protein [Leptolyngbya sp. SIO4C5]
MADRKSLKTYRRISGSPRPHLLYLFHFLGEQVIFSLRQEQKASPAPHPNKPI